MNKLPEIKVEDMTPTDFTYWRQGDKFIFSCNQHTMCLSQEAALRLSTFIKFVFSLKAPPRAN